MTVSTLGGTLLGGWAHCCTKCNRPPSKDVCLSQWNADEILSLFITWWNCNSSCAENT